MRDAVSLTSFPNASSAAARKPSPCSGKSSRVSRTFIASAAGAGGAADASAPGTENRSARAPRERTVASSGPSSRRGTVPPPASPSRARSASRPRNTAALTAFAASAMDASVREDEEED